MTTSHDIDEIDCSFDVDVVGLSNFTDFKSDGVLFDFEANEEIRLFGEADNPFSNNSSYSNNSNEKERLAIGFSPVKPSQKVRKNIFKKNWDEMEKDMFLKGLELFGKKWEKISKFMATKSASQVKRYYQEWSKTGNVIPDSVNLANDSSIYLPFSGDNDEFFTDVDVNCSSDIIRRGHGNNLVCDGVSFTSSSSSYGESHPFGIEIPLGEDIVVSSLNDWNIGSQVSVIGSEEEFLDRSQELLSRKLKCKKFNKIKNGNFGKVKRLTNDKSKKMKSISSPSKDKYNGLNLIFNSKPLPVLEGQIVRINKDEDEDESEVNIDESDDDEKVFEGDCVSTKTEVVCNELKLPISFDGWLEGLTEEERIYLQNISRDEYLFFLSLSFKYSNVDIKKYITARNCITMEWQKVRPFRLDIKQIKTIPEVNIRFYNDIFSYLEIKKVINNDCRANLSKSNKSNISRVINVMKKSIPSRKKTILTKNILDDENLHENVVKNGGGTTFSHDSSGAVVDAVHIPESSSSTKFKTIDLKRESCGQNIKLINYSHYDSKNPQPFRLILHPLTLLSLDFHSHSSFSEVIGLLGGFMDETGVLHVTQAVPTRAFTSNLECEMCPISQKEAFVDIQEKGMKVVGWYHSHPSFAPNPSQKDLDTQLQFQKWFSKNGSPFIGLIISSYSQRPTTSRASVISTFIIDDSLPRQTQRKEVLLPYELKWRIQNESDMEWDEIESILKNILQQKKYQSDLVCWNGEWLDGITYLQKYIFSLSSILPSFNEEVINLVFDYLIETL